mgnify:CR=1 FL=1
MTIQGPISKPSDPAVGLPEEPLSTLASIAEPTLRPSNSRASLPASALADDAALIAACRRGESKAMELLYHQHKRRVFGITQRIVGVGDAEEVVQEKIGRAHV